MSKIEFLHPNHLYLLLLLPPLIGWYIYKLRKVQASFKVATTTAFNNRPRSIKVYCRHLPFILRLITLTLLVIIISRPQSSNSWETSKAEGIDIIMTIDISGTMQAEDFKPNRMEASKKVAAEFISNRNTDRIGLVIYSSSSFTLCPLTTDHRVLLNQIKDIKYGMIEDGTAIGVAIANSVNRIKSSDAKSKVIILLTDGLNNMGQISPLTAAEIAQSYGIRIYTIGVGSKGLAPTPVQTQYGIRYMDIPTDIDEKSLMQIASMTGGQYFRAEDENELKEVYNEIDKLEKSKIDIERVTKREELYLPFAFLALVLILIEIIVRRTWLKSIP